MARFAWVLLRLHRPAPITICVFENAACRGGVMRSPCFDSGRQSDWHTFAWMNVNVHVSWEIRKKYARAPNNTPDSGAMQCRCAPPIETYSYSLILCAVRVAFYRACTFTCNVRVCVCVFLVSSSADRPTCVTKVLNK